MSEVIDDFSHPFLGKTIIKIYGAVGSETMLFCLAGGQAIGFYHNQNCCESVEINDICGDLEDLIGSPLLQAEEATSNELKPTDPFTNTPVSEDAYDSTTWTFYKFATIKGSVTIRWLGSSNGYYSEEVSTSVFNTPSDIPQKYLKEQLLLAGLQP